MNLTGKIKRLTVKACDDSKVGDRQVISNRFIYLLYLASIDSIENGGIYKKYMHSCRISDFGKKVPVWESTNFDAGSYDITGFF
jgi:hypothetical protein